MALDLTKTDGGNGHRRRQLVARVKAEETNCALCGQPVNKTLKYMPGKHRKDCTKPECTGCTPHPMRAEIDEIIPRAKGGSPLERSNLQLTHRKCNNAKSDKLMHQLGEMPTPLRTITASPGW